jgi:two-component system response regulator AtoC
MYFMGDALRVMVIDDEPLMRITVQDALAAEGYKVITAETGGNGLTLLRENQADMVITDLRLPDMDGIQILREVKTFSPETQVILITAYGSIDSAVTAMKQGASDYLTKPFSMDELLLIIKRIQRIRELEEENLSLRKKVEEQFGLEGLAQLPQLQAFKKSL